MKLTATAVKNAKPGRHSDGEGMYLLVTVGHQEKADTLDSLDL